jgi:hypothetical protein
MKNRLALIALALWAVTVTAAGVLFVRGHTMTAPDGRTSVLLQRGERDFVLEEMRQLLVATRGINQGLAQDDRALIAQSARSIGMAAAHDAAPTLLAKLPLDFKRLAMPLHQGFDELAAAAEHGEPLPALHNRLIEQMDRCIACHAAFRLEVEG